MTQDQALCILFMFVLQALRETEMYFSQYVNIYETKSDILLLLGINKSSIQNRRQSNSGKLSWLCYFSILQSLILPGQNKK